MIARIWHGWAAPAHADAYQAFLRTSFLPAAHDIAGYRGAHVFRRQTGGDIEFMTVTFFESVDAIRAFAGDDYEAANVAPMARRLLSRFETRCEHYEVVIRQKAPA
jgi:heme-degrading monooxygenase HmoA